MLELKNISFAYDETPIIRDVSMSFEEGKITGILGANGSGKSTIMKIITQLLISQKGQLYFEGKRVEHTKKFLYNYRQQVNMVFQNPENQLFYTIVRDDIAMALENLGYESTVIDKRIQEVLEMMDIVHLQDEPLQYLSYGQKKRVAIAGMLALKPKYLLLDEPTAGLDPKGRSKMADSMRNLVASGTNIIVSSHDMDLMYDCCDAAYVLKKGEVIAQGDKYSVFQEVDLLMDAGLGVPWIVKLNKFLHTPLVSNEQEFFKIIGDTKWSSQL